MSRPEGRYTQVGRVLVLMELLDHAPDGVPIDRFYEQFGVGEQTMRRDLRAVAAARVSLVIRRRQGRLYAVPADPGPAVAAMIAEARS